MVKNFSSWIFCTQVKFALLLVVLTSGCDRNSNPLNRKGEPIISEQFQNTNIKFPKGVPLFIATVNLVNPALLESAYIDENGQMQVDENLKQRILAEQEDFVLKLKGLSQDIRVVQKFRMVLNAITIEAPQQYAEQINGLPVDFIEGQKLFVRPNIIEDDMETAVSKNLNLKNSMTAIGVDLIHKNLKVMNKEGIWVPVKGQGKKIGIIDSGIDYTHAMLGGSGDKSIYESINPNQASSYFPNAKVKGGLDFVGANFNPSSHLYINNRPYPDPNPLDYSGHGSHVAGTAAGVGDGINTYDGAAPEAELYALKVFGDKGGGTSDSVVMAALEYAVDPLGDMSMKGKLDIVNLSLGNSYGRPADLYNIAIRNLTKAGVLAVGSAGNEGPIPNIVGSPGVSDDMLTVAASVDDMDHNLLFEAIRITTKDVPEKAFLLEFADGAITTPIKEVKALSGKLVYLGLADQDLPADIKLKLKDQIALIDRGVVDFATKIKRAVEGGALGVLMVNNQEGDPISMGGEEDFAVPGVMVSQSDGEKIKEALKLSEVFVDFKPEEKIRKDELINTMAEFSSQGPRGFDGLIKPEVTAPGVQIISALAGSGSEGVKFNGTSMATPHIAGVGALLMQYRSDLGPLEIKSTLMNTALVLDDEKGKVYPVSRQGAGLVQAFKAAQAKFAVLTPAMSLGKLAVSERVVAYKTLNFKNISESAESYSLEAPDSPELKFSFSSHQISLAPGETKNVSVRVDVSTPAIEVVEIDAFIKINKNGLSLGQIPVLAILNKTTVLSADELQIGSVLDGQSIKNVKLNLINKGTNSGEALVFNLIGEDERKPKPKNNTLTSACDIQSAGFRVVNKSNKKVLQVGVKIYNPVSTWEPCDVSVELDTSEDEQPEFEIIGSFPSGWRLDDTQEINDLPLSSMLFDYNILNKLWNEYEAKVIKQQKTEPEVSFQSALISINPMTSYNSSTIAIVEAPIEELKLTSGSIALKVSTSYGGRYNVERTDVLSDSDKEWHTVDVSDISSAYFNIPEKISIDPKSQLEIDFLVGDKATNDLLVYYPRNRFSLRNAGLDQQSQILSVKPEDILLTSAQ